MQQTIFHIFNNAHYYLKEVLLNDSFGDFCVCVEIIIPVQLQLQGETMYQKGLIPWENICMTVFDALLIMWLKGV